MEQKYTLKECPKCSKAMNSPLQSTGRQICKFCGWTNKKKISSIISQENNISFANKISTISKRIASHGLIKIKSNKKFAYTIGVVFSISLLGYGVTTLVSNHQANTCKNDTKQAFGKVSEEWDDVMSRAKSSNRMNMLANVSDLQKIKRELSDSQWPQCSFVAKSAFRAGMQSDINQLLDFAGGDDISYKKSFIWTIFSDEKKQIDKSGRSKNSANSEEEAKEVISSLLDAEIEKIDSQLEILKKPYGEYSKRNDQISSYIEASDDYSYISSLYDNKRDLKTEYSDIVYDYERLAIERLEIKIDQSQIK